MDDDVRRSWKQAKNGRTFALEDKDRRSRLQARRDGLKPLQEIFDERPWHLDYKFASLEL